MENLILCICNINYIGQFKCFNFYDFILKLISNIFTNNLYIFVYVDNLSESHKLTSLWRFQKYSTCLNVVSEHNLYIQGRVTFIRNGFSDLTKKKTTV